MEYSGRRVKSRQTLRYGLRNVLLIGPADPAVTIPSDTVFVMAGFHAWKEAAATDYLAINMENVSKFADT